MNQNQKKLYVVDTTLFDNENRKYYKFFTIESNIENRKWAAEIEILNFYYAEGKVEVFTNDWIKVKIDPRTIKKDFMQYGFCELKRLNFEF